MQSPIPTISMSSKQNPSHHNEAASSGMGRDPLSSIPDPSQIQPSKSPLHDRNNRAGGGPDTTPAKAHSHRASNGGPKCSFSRSRPDRRVSLLDPDPALCELPHFDLTHDHSFWERYNVQVLIRIRPLSDVEKVSQGYGRCLRQEGGNTLAWTPHPETRFTFDHIACETISQEKLFTVAGLPMVDNCMSGYNSCMFAYGQTGSGKTYTMMGDISHVPETGKLSEDCGITPRIFYYLFSRIREEENKRRNEGLKYSCKCSFLEIYNEHITDLLEPSSNNLQLREDLKKGVYVENLTEYTVSTVDDVLRLLSQGAANRKMAATYMNSESSRSHSVFTCIVESRWEKDSMTHLRFGRLNLVDLAGSERQKSSGAEGDRLKEAANINKSLSTLGFVIMSLVDLAQGKQRHVPYRDSRLTFLLQDSLGGNSKTTIIANVSPSLCSANETLSTLKFAQRAKLIQNNAKVNEDASGDVMALQREIQQLKGQLSSLLHHGNSSENFLHPSTSFKEVYLSGFREGVVSSVLSNPPDIRGAMQTGMGMKVEASNIRSDLVEDGTHTCDDGERTEKALIFQHHNIQSELIHAKSLIEAMESNQICMIEELESLRKENNDLREILKNQANGVYVHGTSPGVVGGSPTSEIWLQAKLEKLSKDLLETQLLDRRYLEDHAMELCHSQQTQVVQAEVEMETAQTIVQLQEEIARVQSELHGRLHSLEEENGSLRKRMEAKEADLKAVCCDWERATFELTAFLLDGSRSLKDASSQIENITSLFPRENGWISEHVERAAKLCVDKEESLRLLKSSLENARSTVLEMEHKLNSLRALAQVEPMKGFEMSQSCEEIMPITHAGKKFTTQADSFFTRFEEVQGTMKEADCMLNALLRSNEDVKYWSSVWAQAGSDVRTQRDSLVEEIKQLNSSVQEREERNELLQDQMYVTLIEISTLIQQEGEELCKVAYSDAIFSVKEALSNVSCLRSLVEDVSSKVKKHGIVSSLLQDSFLIGDQNHVKQFEEVAVVHRERMVGTVCTDEEKSEIEGVQRTDEAHDENLELKRELERKKVVLKGLLFDISLLQESATSRKYVKEEVDKLTETLNQVQKELKMKTNQLETTLIQYAALEGRLSETENALVVSNSDLEEVRLALDGLSDLKILVKDLYQKKSEADQQLEEQAHAMEDLENEILRMATSAEENLSTSMKDTRNDMARVMIERDSLLDLIQSLENKLDIAYALTDEKEAIILEIRQESEASKEYAELKEEEVKILTHSVEELESTINVLEKKVYEMEEEVERHHEVRNSLEVEVQDMRERLLMVENMTEDMDSRSSRGELCSSKSLGKLHEGSTELWKAHNHIRTLEKEKEKLAKQIKQYKEYVSELVVHAEAQTSQYQQKYKNLESMVHEVRTDSSKVMNGAPISEKACAKPRGSSSPFRCISNLVQQMNLEKDHELSVSQLRIAELEALVASQQKEASLLNTRLASVESMTHDVIRDLLGVKLDITNYSDLLSENRLQKLVEEAQQYIKMERETVDLRKRIHDLVEERESYAMEAVRREADGLATRVALEQIRERAQMLTAQNEMLKADKTNLQRRVAELDHTVGLLMQNVGLPETERQQQLQFLARRKDRRSSSVGRLH